MFNLFKKFGNKNKEVYPEDKAPEVPFDEDSKRGDDEQALPVEEKIVDLDSAENLSDKQENI